MERTDGGLPYLWIWKISGNTAEAVKLAFARKGVHITIFAEPDHPILASGKQRVTQRLPYALESSVVDEMLFDRVSIVHACHVIGVELSFKETPVTQPGAIPLEHVWMTETEANLVAELLAQGFTVEIGHPHDKGAPSTRNASFIHISTKDGFLLHPKLEPNFQTVCEIALEFRRRNPFDPTKVHVRKPVATPRTAKEVAKQIEHMTPLKFEEERWSLVSSVRLLGLELADRENTIDQLRITNNELRQQLEPTARFSATALGRKLRYLTAALLIAFDREKIERTVSDERDLLLYRAAMIIARTWPHTPKDLSSIEYGGGREILERYAQRVDADPGLL